jgi:hypothetical protein
MITTHPITSKEAAQLRDEKRGGTQLDAVLQHVYTDIRRSAADGSDGVTIDVAERLRDRVIDELRKHGYRLDWNSGHSTIYVSW